MALFNLNLDILTIIWENSYFFCKLLQSLLSWERGLKSAYQHIFAHKKTVAPIVGAWIEIASAASSSSTAKCRSYRGSVD